MKKSIVGAAMLVKPEVIPIVRVQKRKRRNINASAIGWKWRKHTIAREGKLQLKSYSFRVKVKNVPFHQFNLLLFFSKKCTSSINESEQTLQSQISTLDSLRKIYKGSNRRS